MVNRFRAIASYFMPLFLGVCFVAAAKLPPYVRPERRFTLLVAVFAVVVVAVAGAALLAARGAMPLRKSLHVALTPSVFASGAFGLFMLVEHELARYAVAALAMVLLGAHFAYVNGMRREGSRYGDEDLRYLSFALHVVTMFFVFAFAFGAASFTTLPRPVIALALGGLIGVFAWETLWHEGFATRQWIPVALAFGVLGAQFYLALSFLPTAWPVNSAVALILFVSALHASVRILKGIQILRRQFILTLSLTLLVLCTARWT